MRTNKEGVTAESSKEDQELALFLQLEKDALEGELSNHTNYIGEVHRPLNVPADKAERDMKITDDHKILNKNDKDLENSCVNVDSPGKHQTSSSTVEMSQGRFRKNLSGGK